MLRIAPAERYLDIMSNWRKRRGFRRQGAPCSSVPVSRQTGAIVPMIGDGDYIVTDSENHASIIQGTLIAKAAPERAGS